jgi:selenocysteine-specific elongation factor
VRKFDARLRVLADEARPLAHWTPVHVHLGAADVTGRVALLEGAGIAPGATGLVQLVLDRPLGALRGDGFILRDQSSRRTLAGGRVIDVFPPPRGRARPERLAALAAQERDDPGAALEALLAGAPAGLDLARFAMNRNLTRATLEALCAQRRMQRVGDWGYAIAHWEALRAQALDALAAWHRRAPDSVGPPESRLLEGSGLRLPREVLAALADALLREAAIVREGAGLRLAGHRLQLSGADDALWRETSALLERSGLRPPSVAELAAALGTDARKLDAALSRLERHGLLVRVSKTRFFLPAMLRRLEALAEEEARASGAITAAAFRDRAGIGRNLTIEVLEFFDRIKFTRRKGDAHVLLRETRGRESHPGGAPGLQIQ